MAGHCLIIVQASLFPNLSVFFGRPNQHSLGLVSCSMIPTDSLEKKTRSIQPDSRHLKYLSAGAGCLKYG